MCLFHRKEGRPKFFYGYIIVLCGFSFGLLGWGMWATFPIFFEPMLAELGWTRAATSGAFSLYLVVTALLGTVMGRLNDRFGPRIIITLCGLSFGLGYSLTSQISAIWQLYLFYGVMLGLGLSGYIAVNSTVARWFVKRRGLVLGIISTGFSLGLMLFPIPALRLLSACGWRNSYIIIGLITMLLVILAAQFLKRDPGKIGLAPYGGSEIETKNKNLQISGLSFQKAMGTKQLWMLCTVFALLLMSYAAVYVHIVIYAAGLGISAASAANILVISGAVGIPGGIILGSTIDRIGSRRVLTIICALVLAASVWLIAAKELWMLCLFAAVFGFAFGGFWSVTTVSVAELFGLKAHGAILGFASLVGLTGEAVGPVMAGHIFDVTNSYHAAFLVCIVVSLIGFILSLLLRPISIEEHGN